MRSSSGFDGIRADRHLGVKQGAPQSSLWWEASAIAPVLTGGQAARRYQAIQRTERADEMDELQQPLAVQDEGDSWVIEGSREYDYEAPRRTQMVDGKALIEIAKANGAIRALTKTIDLAEPKSGPR